MTYRTDGTSAQSLASEIAESCIGVRVRILNRIVTRIYDNALRENGIKFSQLNILTTVTLRGPVQPIEVARLLSMEKSTLSRNVRILQANGWLHCGPGESGNTQLLRISESGRKTLEQGAPAWREAQAQVTTLLGERSSKSLRSAANRLWEFESSE